MILIDKIVIDNVIFNFYEGIDFELLINHTNDGSDGFIFCFIDNWITEIKSYNRQKKISSLIDDLYYEEFDWEKINNNFISVYQTEGMGISEVYKTIRKKVERKQFGSTPWIGGMTTGAWKIQVGKIMN